MKTILRSLAVAVSLLFCASMNAQNLSYEATLGLGFSGYKYSYSGISLKYDAVGVRLGGVAEYGLSNVMENLYVNGGLLLSLEGCKMNDNTSMNPWFLNIPIHVGYKYPVLDMLDVYAEVGPYVGIGLFGNNVSKYDNETLKTACFSDEGGLKRFQFGLGFKVGVVALGNYKLFLGWDWNFLNVMDLGSDGGKFSHNNGYLGVSYVF